MHKFFWSSFLFRSICTSNPLFISSWWFDSKIPDNIVLQRENLILDPAKQLLWKKYQRLKDCSSRKRYHFTYQYIGGSCMNIQACWEIIECSPRVAGPLFCHFDMSPSQIAWFPLPETTRYKVHSFRIGASTLLALKSFL